jgi:TolB protein
LREGVVLGVGVLAALAVVIPLRALSGLGDGSTPGGGRTGEVLAFTRETDGRPQTWLVAPDGSDLRLMDIPVYSQVDPAWSPDGSRLVFSGTNERNTEPTFVFIVNADGSGLEQLTDAGGGQADGDPAWSPDGSRIVFSRLDVEGHSALFILDLESRAVEEVLSERYGFFQMGTPDWSPDGTRIAFTGNIGGKAGVFVVGADGENLTEITSLRGDDVASSPVWSPDGRRLAYDWHGDIYVQELDGGDVTNVTGASVQPEALYEAAPGWSPDGEEIAFMGGSARVADPYVMSADGTSVRRLTSNEDGGYSPGGIEGPSWGTMSATADPRDSEAPSPADSVAPPAASPAASDVIDAPSIAIYEALVRELLEIHSETTGEPVVIWSRLCEHFTREGRSGACSQRLSVAEQDALAARLVDLGPIRFNDGFERGETMLLLGPILDTTKGIRVEGGYWCGSLCAGGAMYIVEDREGDYVVTGTDRSYGAWIA